MKTQINVVQKKSKFSKTLRKAGSDWELYLMALPVILFYAIFMIEKKTACVKRFSGAVFLMKSGRFLPGYLAMPDWKVL